MLTGNELSRPPIQCLVRGLQGAAPEGPSRDAALDALRHRRAFTRGGQSLMQSPYFAGGPPSNSETYLDSSCSCEIRATRTTISLEKNQPASRRHVCALPTSEEAVTLSG